MSKSATPGTEGHNSQPVTLTVLKEALKEHSDLKEEINSATGSLRAAIKVFVKEHKLNKAAYAKIRDIAAMSQTDRSDFIRTFEPLFLMMMEDKWRAELNDLLKSLEDEDSEDENEE